MKKVAVLYLSYDGMTDPLGESQVIPYLQGIAAAGYRVSLVSFEKPERARFRKSIAARLADSQIEWVPLSYTKSPAVLSTLYDLYRLHRKVLSLHKQRGFRLVHCRSYLTALVGLRLKQQYKVPFVFDMRGFFADERVEGGLWPQAKYIYRRIYRYFKQKEQVLLSQADWVVSLTERARQILAARTDLPQPLRIQVIPCCVETHLFDPAQVDSELAASYREKLGLPAEAEIYTYLGSIGTWYMLEEMLAFFGQLHRARPQSVLLFVTTEPAEAIRQSARAQGLPAAAISVVSARREEVPIWLSLSRAAIFFIKPVFSKQASSPTKQGEVMAMGLPLICNRGVGDTDWVVEKYGSGLLVDANDPASYAKAVEALADLSAFDPAKIRAGALDFFALSKGVNRYLEIYRKLAPLPFEPAHNPYTGGAQPVPRGSIRRP